MCSLNTSNEHEVVELGRAAGIVGEASQWIGLFLELLSVAAKLEKNNRPNLEISNDILYGCS